MQAANPNRRHDRLTRRAPGRRLALLLLSLLLADGGCTSGVPRDHPRKESSSLALSTGTALGRDASQWSADHGGQSGYLPLSEGIDALGLRLHLMQLAEKTIDAQYFLIKPDLAGTLFLGKLLRAADRGVRVRLLIDDIFTPDMDSELSLLTSHPDIEVRLFNPLARSRLRLWSLLTDFRRMNRRMHNKSFTVDGAYTIVGGRNLADEYFQTREDVSFLDYEVVAIGPVAGEVGETFDDFWNSGLAIPIDAFGVRFDEAELQVWRERLRNKIDFGESGVYRRATESQLLNDLIDGVAEPIAAVADVVTDRPQKLKETPGLPEHRALAEELLRRVSDTKRELLLVTPYFIPQAAGTKVLSDLARRGVRVVVVTNSLASTNHAVVHSGYSRYREQLLAAGVELYEARVDAKIERNADAPRVTLHTKAAIFDREVLFVGSLNLGPRSIDLNTEMGLFIRSDSLAGRAADALESILPELAYEVRLDDSGATEWVWRGAAGDEQRLSHEPDTSIWRRLLSHFYGLLPIEGQL